MQLTTFVSGTPTFTVDDTQDAEDHFYFGYFVNGVLHYRTNQLVSDKDYWRFYEATVKLDVNANTNKVKLSTAGNPDSLYNEDEALAMLALEATGANGYSLALSRKSDETNNRAVFGDYATLNTTPRTAPSTAYTDASHDFVASNAPVKLVKGGAKYYFGMYVEGSNQTGANSSEVTDGENDITGGFTVTATAAHTSYN